MPYDASTASDPNWTRLDATAPLIAYYKWNPQDAASLFPTDDGLTFSPDVLAAMTVQNFNPAQIGGVNVPPQTSLTAGQIQWLQTVGWGAQLQTWEATHSSSSASSASSSSSGTSSASSSTASGSAGTASGSTPSAPPASAPSSTPATTAHPTASGTSPASSGTASASGSTHPAVSSPVTGHVPAKAAHPGPDPLLRPVTPQLATHPVKRALVADAARRAEHPAQKSSASPWPWVGGGAALLALLAGGGLWLRRRLA